MSLLKNRYYLYLVIVAALVVGSYLCSVSVICMMAFCFVAPLLLGYMLRQFLDDHDFSDELSDDGLDAKWRSTRF